MAFDGRVQIINTGLFACGKGPVPDLTATSLAKSDAAVKLLGQLQPAFQAVLERHGWLCALAYAQPGPYAPAGYVLPWKYATGQAYQAPAGCLRVWEVRTANLDLPFAELDWLSFGMIGPPLIEGERWEMNTIDNADGTSTMIILSDVVYSAGPPACGIAMSYVRTPNFSALTSNLTDAIGWECARRAGWNITGDTNQAQRIATEAEQKILMAISIDGTQEGAQFPVAPSVPARLRLVSR
jgi:hypothetical protein